MITIIVSTNRSGSFTRSLSELIHKRLSQRNVPSQILDLRLLPQDFPYRKIENEAVPDFDRVGLEMIGNVEKFIFVIPEYNGSFPGILKAFMDSLPTSFWKGKKSSLVGLASGKAGALRALDHFTGVLHYLQVEVLSDKPRFPQIDKILSHEPDFKDIEDSKRLDLHLDKFLRF